ncbi:MAG: phosphoribosylaminoimidazolesuccinocarboxamide synthase [Planctomycetota bacterium]
MEIALRESRIPGLKPPRRGKVRDVYDLGDKLLFVASDRISAFDCVLPNGIPWKGKVLTAMSLFWFDFLKGVTKNHLLTTDLSGVTGLSDADRALLAGRSMVVTKAEVIPFECVVRGYLAGSAVKEYRKSGTVCGIRLPMGLRESEKLPEPLFTPSTKAETGHDENISFEEMAKRAGADMANSLRNKSLAVYKKAADYAAGRGILLVDTKFEWGRKNGDILLVDEVLTPDSSRFAPAESYAPGRPFEAYDKQYVRNYLERLPWNKQPPAPELSPEVVAKTTEKYLMAYRALTGKELGESSRV